MPEGPKSGGPDLIEASLEHAREAVRLAGNELPLRGVPIGKPQVEWSRGHLRQIHDQRVGVYEELGEFEAIYDRLGRLLELKDPRHEPTSLSIEASIHDTLERIGRLVGLPRSAPGLRHEVCHEGDVRYFKVTTIPPPPEPGAGGMLMTPPHQEVEAYVNALTGGVYRLKSTPEPRRRIVRRKPRKASDEGEA